MTQISNLSCSIRVRMPSDNLVHKSWLWWVEKMLPPFFIFTVYSGRKSRSMHAASWENLWELFSCCRASGSVAAITYLPLKLVNSRHSLFSQVSIYIWPILSCIFMLCRLQPFPEAAPHTAGRCLCKLSFRQDDMPVSSHKLFTCIRWVMYHRTGSKPGRTCVVKMQCKALYCCGFPQQGV